MNTLAGRPVVISGTPLDGVSAGGPQTAWRALVWASIGPSRVLGPGCRLQEDGDGRVARARGDDKAISRHSHPHRAARRDGVKGQRGILVLGVQSAVRLPLLHCITDHICVIYNGSSVTCKQQQQTYVIWRVETLHSM